MMSIKDFRWLALALLAFFFSLDASAQQKNSVTSILEVLDTKTGERKVVKEFNYLIEAPNWTRDGKRARVMPDSLTRSI